ncbi:MAG: hypothetical protein ACYTAN_10540 [Planctomycetota bacterium]|jgi:hypothetical protein
MWSFGVDQWVWMAPDTSRCGSPDNGSFALTVLLSLVGYTGIWWWGEGLYLVVWRLLPGATPHAVRFVIGLVLVLDFVFLVNFAGALCGPVNNVMIGSACILPILIYEVRGSSGSESLKRRLAGVTAALFCAI